MTRISVCIATVRAATIRTAIASILGQTWSDWELIVVGQGHREELETAVMGASNSDRRVRYVHSDRMGLSVARNRALSVATGEIIASTDDDCEARADWLAVLERCFAESPTLGLVGGSLLAPPAAGGGRPSSCLSIVPGEVLYDPATIPTPPPPGFNWVGGNFALRRSTVERVGRFDELLGEGAPFRSAEDRDYLHRLEAAGIPMLSTPRSVVLHTYGRRYGVSHMAKYWRGQGSGDGAAFAKLTLRGDPRGPVELPARIRRYPTAWLDPRKPGEGSSPGVRAPQRLISDAVRIPAFAQSYRRCLRQCVVDQEGLLRPLGQAKSISG